MDKAVNESNISRIYTLGMDSDPNIFTLGIARQPATEIPSHIKTLRLYEKARTEAREEEEEMGKALVVIVVVVAVVAVAYFVLYRNKGRH